MDKLFNVFVYGTLRKYEGNHRLLKEAKCLARQCWTNGVLYDTGCGYPAMATSRTKRVYGEVYEVSFEQLKQLDYLEGYTGEGSINHYDRITQTIYTDFGEIQAFVYIYLPEQVTELKEIAYGDWKCLRYLKQEDLLYFAYGSCMDDERFYKSGVAEQFSRVKGCGVVSNYSLAYTRRSHDGGRADLIDSTEAVEGKVYEIEQNALNYLFRREGVNANIYRPTFIDVTINGEPFNNVLTFLVIDKQEEVAPPEHYITEILRGSKGFVSDEYYKKLQADLFRKFGIQ